MRAVNLLPRDEGRRKAQRKAPRPVVLVAAIGGSIVVTGLAAGVILTSSSLAGKREELEQRTIELAVTPPPPAQPSQIQTGLAGQQAPRVAAVSSALAGRVSWDRVLRRFSLVLPDDVWLRTLSVKSPVGGAEPAPGATPTGFSISGYTYSHAAVARLLSRLAVLPDITNVQLQRSNLTKLGSQEIVEFAILADVRPPGAAS
ncbi:MAG: PilN domain-containing protein [Gaiellaceae bacterium]